MKHVNPAMGGPSGNVASLILCETLAGRARGPLNRTVASLHASVHAPVSFRKVARQIAGVMENASHLDYAVGAAAIEKEMPRLLHP